MSDIDDIKPPVVMNKVTEEQIKHCLPKGVNAKVTPEIVHTINNIIDNCEYAEEYRNNLFSYTTVLMNPKYKLADYVKAAQFVTYKLLGDSNKLAYAKTFPDRFDRLIQLNKSEKDISAYTSAYAANEMVVRITEQTVMPLHIVNNDLRQQAINVLAQTMLNEATSPKVRVEAANTLLTHTAPPKDSKIEISLGQNQASVISELYKATVDLAAQQKTMIQSGLYNAKDIAEAKLIIDVDAEEIN